MCGPGRRCGGRGGGGVGYGEADLFVEPDGEAGGSRGGFGGEVELGAASGCAFGTGGEAGSPLRPCGPSVEMTGGWGDALGVAEAGTGGTSVGVTSVAYWSSSARRWYWASATAWALRAAISAAASLAASSASGWRARPPRRGRRGSSGSGRSARRRRRRCGQARSRGAEVAVRRGGVGWR